MKKLFQWEILVVKVKNLSFMSNQPRELVLKIVHFFDKKTLGTRTGNFSIFMEY